MQSPRAGRSRHAHPAIRLAVAATFATALGGYALALGVTGLPVLLTAVAGMIVGLVCVSALTP
ncbi:MAG: hypothetical protein JHC95_20225 [Solirubrobacteraceae bacterium]|nr:hypothetical protein [Solirubrobacteraceae bacterium]